MIHHVYANRSNIGDWLSARGIQSLLKPHTVIEHWCDEPFVTETLVQLESATEEDLIVIGGGGLFMDYFEPFWEGFLTIAERVPFVIWGVGYCDMKRTFSRPRTSLLKEIVKRSRLCQVRDELTRSYLRQCNLPPPVPCPSMSVISVPSDPAFGILYADAYDNIGPNVYEQTITNLKQYAAITGRSYHQTNNTIPQANEPELKRILRLYDQADLVVASRLHGCIFGVSMGQKVLAISGDRKVESFMRAAGLEKWVLDVDQIDCLAERIKALPSQASTSNFVAEARNKNHFFSERVNKLITGSQHPLGSPD